MRKLLFLGILVLPFFAFAADCPAGSSPISSDADLKLAQASNPKATMGMCWDRTDATGTDASSAKQYLKSLSGGGTYTKCSTETRPTLDAQFGNINDTFAKCAAKFLQAYQSATNDKVRITRSSNNTRCEGQMCYMNSACGRLATHSPNATVNSNHTAGLAMDVVANGGQNAIAQFAKQNPQFGVCFPFVGSSFNDTVHMILAAAPGTEVNGPGCAGVSRSGCEGAKFDPNSVRTAPASSPTAPFDDTIRRLLGQQPQQQQLCTIAGGYTVPCDSIKNGQTPASPASTPAPVGAAPAATPAPSPITGTGAQICSPQFYCSGNDVYYQTSACVNQLSQSCPNGCSNGACLVSQTSTNILNSALSSTTATVSPRATSTGSVFDQLDLFAHPDQVNVPSSVATSVELVISGSQAVQLSQQPKVPLVPPTPEPTQHPIIPETFVSPDLAGNTTLSSQSPLLSLLGNFKTILLRVLDYLKPFGGAPSVSPGGGEEYSY